MPFLDDGSWRPRPIRIGVTGHRMLADDLHTGVRDACRQVLESMVEVGRINGAGVEAWSALAIGADTLFAQAALELDLPLVGIMPFAHYPRDFAPADLVVLEGLIERCDRMIRLDRIRKTKHAYMAAGTMLVRECDLVVAVWNGMPSRALGGTGDVVRYAERLGVPVVRVDPARAGSSTK